MNSTDENLNFLPTYLSFFGEEARRIFQNVDQARGKGKKYSLALESLEMVQREVGQIYRAFQLYGDYERLLMDKCRHRKAYVNLPEFILGIVLMAAPYARNCKCKYTYELPRGPVIALVEPEPLTKILCHLLSNACRYSVPGGKICTQMVLREKEAQIMVWDYGEDIPWAESERLFEPYYTYNPQGGYSGTGLGLTVSKMYAEFMGGRLDIFAGVLGYSNFSLTIPLRRVKPNKGSYENPQKALLELIMADAYPIWKAKLEEACEIFSRNKQKNNAASPSE